MRDGRVLHVGTNAEVLEAPCDQDFTVDARYAERVIVPGFIEAHGHLFSDGALGQLVWTGFDDRPRPDSSVARGCRSIEDVIARLSERARETGTTVIGYGFDPVFHDGRAVRREDLDRVLERGCHRCERERASRLRELGTDAALWCHRVN